MNDFEAMVSGVEREYPNLPLEKVVDIARNRMNMIYAEKTAKIAEQYKQGQLAKKQKFICRLYCRDTGNPMHEFSKKISVADATPENLRRLGEKAMNRWNSKRVLNEGFVSSFLWFTEEEFNRILEGCGLGY